MVALPKSIPKVKGLSSPIPAIERGDRPTKRAKEWATMSEVEVDSFWPFQVGGPGLLPSPPISGRYVTQSEAPRRGDEAVTCVRELCSRLGIEVHCIDFVERSDRTPGAEMQLALQLLVSRNTDLTAVGKRLCIDAYRLLLECDLGQVHSRARFI